MISNNLTERLREKFLQEFAQRPARPCRLFLSATDMKSRAIVRHVSDIDPIRAWDSACEQLKSALGEINPAILRAEWVVSLESMTWQDFLQLIGRTRRNYFRRGFALPDFSIAFTEQELNANLMLYKGGKAGKSNGVFNVERSNQYCRTRFECDFPKLGAESSIVVFETAGIFIADGMARPLTIDASGHRPVSPLDSELCLRIARKAADHLARQVEPSGKFVYGLFPCSNKVVPSYNTLRHFSSTFAMLDVYETYDQTSERDSERAENLRHAINRSFDYAVKNFVVWRQLPNGEFAAYIEEPSSKELKLGALGVPIVALAKFTELMQTPKYIPLMRALARGIKTMQNDDGSFVHVLNSEDFSIKEPFRIVYYDGEAVFGMMRLYSITHDANLLEASELAFKRFIATDHWQNHDHWLSYAVNELTKYQPRREYFEFGINNFLDFLPFIYHRDTQYPTLMELMMAADTMLERMKKMPEMSDLLARVPLDDFYAALESRAANMLNGFFYPETAMYFACPESINETFFMRHHEFRARNDDIEHFLSGFVNYRRYLARRDHDPKPSQELLNAKATGNGIVNKPAVDTRAINVSKDIPIAKPIERPSGEAVIFYGGDVVLARRMHWRIRECRQFGNIPAMRNADLRLVNLECVVATCGEQGVEKGEGGPYYYHARPEQLNIVTQAGIEAVLTANNHCGDYGPEAILEQKKYLDEAGLMYCGSGANIEDASRPLFVRVNDLIIAIYSLDATMKYYAATEDRAGVWYLPPKEPELWREEFTKKIAEARKHADVVIVAPHWGAPGLKKPNDDMKKLGRVLIDCGADAVLGCHSHNIHGIEKYNERPIVYDAGNLLFETVGGEKDTGGFSLLMDRNGVKRVSFTPLRNGYGYVSQAVRSGERINKWFVGMCNELDTAAEITAEGTVVIDFNPAPRGVVEHVDDQTPIFNPPLERHLISQLSEPRPEWTVERVPDEAIIKPVRFGPLKMIGYRVPPECRTMLERRMLFVETYWTIEEPVDADCRLLILGRPIRECRMPTFGLGMDHDFCDWMWPVNRWKPGVIYREKFGLRPPWFNLLYNVDLRVEIGVSVDGEKFGSFVDSEVITLKMEHAPYYRSDFPDVIYQSKPGQCWNAEQLAAVTGGKWLVPPPKGWFVQSLMRPDYWKPEMMPQPTMYVACSFAEHRWHAGGDLTSQKWDTHARIGQYVSQTAGAIISHPVPGLPPDYPLLMVKNPVGAAMELGFASRQRFQGRMIAVTGTSGKTTTCHMLSHVLGQEHEVAATYRSANTRVMAPHMFANIRQETAFAIIEMAVSALYSPRGSITNELKPNIAVVTSLALAHADFYKTIEHLAFCKSWIMCGMEPGGYAILNRDMPCYEVFEKRALDTKLNIITFGTHPDSTLHMARIENGGTFTFNGKSYVIESDGPSEHIYDALAVVGVTIATGLPIEKTLEFLKSFKTIEGRGNIMDVVFNGKKLRLINSSYNANLLSMQGALGYLKTQATDAAHRVAILGDMLELGKDEIDIHRSVAKYLLDAKPDRVLLVGELMKHLYDDVKDQFQCAWFPTYKELNESIDEWLRDGDTILLKSSHGTALDRTVAKLAKISNPPSAQNSTLQIPEALFDVREFLPEGITPEQNGRMPLERMMKVTGGGMMYIDAARSLEAMIGTAAREGVLISVKKPFNCYRTFAAQESVFKKRFTPLDDTTLRADLPRVEFEGKIWQLNEGAIFAQVPGSSSHGYGLAVDIQNVGTRATKNWLDAHSEEFGFKIEWEFENWHYTYVKSREGIPARAVEFEASERRNNIRNKLSDVVYNSTPGKCWTLKQIEAVVGNNWSVRPSEDWFVNSVTRARKWLDVSNPPILFVASTGECLRRHEGSRKKLSWNTADTLPEICARTAGAIVDHIVEGLPPEYPQLITNDPIQALIDLGFAARSRFQGKVMAITGTVGKSTVTDMIGYALKDKNCISSVDNYNSRVGIPHTLASLPRDFDYAILEIAMSALWMNHGPITYDVQPHVSIITEIGMSQTINTALRTMKDIAEIKSRVFHGMTSDGIAVIHDRLPCFDYVLEQAKKYASRQIICGTTDAATSKILEMIDTAEGHHVRASIEGEAVEFDVKPHGMASVMNMMLTLGALKAVGEESAPAIELLSNYQSLYGRLEYRDVMFDGKNIRVIDDSWNAEVLSFKRALDAAPHMIGNGGRLIGVLGRIVNLGSLSEQLHKGMRDMVVETNFDYIITHGDEMKFLREVLPQENLGPHFSDAPSLIEHLKTVMRDDDTILIKGSRRDSDFGTLGVILTGESK